MTPRRTHASSTLAFPRHCDYACAVERVRRTWPIGRAVICLLAFAVCGVLLAYRG